VFVMDKELLKMRRTSLGSDYSGFRDVNYVLFITLWTGIFAHWKLHELHSARLMVEIDTGYSQGKDDGLVQESRFNRRAR